MTLLSAAGRRLVLVSLVFSVLMFLAAVSPTEAAGQSETTVTIESSSQDATFATASPWPSGLGYTLVEPRLSVGVAEDNYGEVFRSALQFTLSAVPPNSTVSRATLKLYWDGTCWLGIYPRYLAPRFCSTHDIQVHKLLSAWSTTSTPASLNIEATALASAVVNRFEPARWLLFDVTDIVNRWRDGSAANHGFMLKRSSEQQWAGGIAPRSATDPDPALRPKLEIAYVDHVLDVTLNPLVATSRNPNTIAHSSEWGANVESTIAGPASAHHLGWHFALASGQSLKPLANGGFAVVNELPASVPPPVEDDFSDAQPIGPGDSNTLTDQDVPGIGFRDPNDPPYLDDGGGEDFDYGQPTDEGEAAMEAIGAAQDELADEVAAVASPPRAHDSSGNPRNATFSIVGNSVVLNVDSGGAYPLTVEANMYEFLEEPDAQSGDSASANATALASPECPVRPQIISYNPNGWQPLLDAFKDSPTPCADYYIVIPGLASDKTKFRITTPRIVDTVCAGDQNSVGARFHPVAEFHWNDWKRFYIDSLPANERDTIRAWRKAGQEFRRRMARVGGPGYGTSCASTGNDIFPRWAVNELPDNPRDPGSSILPNSMQSNDVIRQRAIQLLIGLHDGPDGKKQGYRNTRGIIFAISREHAETNFKGRSGPVGPPSCSTCFLASYRDGVRGLLLRRAWWNAIRPRILLWSQETFTNCWKVCLPQIQHVPTRGKLVSNYIYHPLHFLDAGLRDGTASEKDALRAARFFFRGEATRAKPGRYSPLLTAYWHGSAYGETAGFPNSPPGRDLDIMKGHVSLQIFTRRRQTGNHPRPRLGFAWNRAAGSGTEELAQWVAARVRAAYSPTGTANDACFVVAGGTNWCQQSVPSTSSPQEKRTVQNLCWPQNFRNWTSVTRNCF